MPSNIIQWFPGHMAKTRRMIKENLASVDAVVELLDARIPQSSRNPELRSLTAGKPVLTVMSRSALADPEASAVWEKHFAENGGKAVFCDFITGDGVRALVPALREVCNEKLQRYEDRGMAGRAVKAMVVGIPNVGKSTLINTVCGCKSAKAENRPGVTLTKQWLRSPAGVDFLDMPGILWPKFEDRTVGENLAATGAIKNEVLNPEDVAFALCRLLQKLYPALLCARYKLESAPEIVAEADTYGIFCAIARKRGCIVSGGEIDDTRIARLLLDEFRAGKIGRITLERP